MWESIAASTLQHPLAGWAVAVSLGVYTVRQFGSGRWYTKAQHDEVVAFTTKAAADTLVQFDRLQETHAQTTAQNGELMETARFTRAVVEAVEKSQQLPRGGST